MRTLSDLIAFLEAFAPPALAESWDNVGLLVGDRHRAVSRVMTCLTITKASADEAIAAQADLIVTHHPLPFRPFKRLTTDTPEGRLLLALITAGVAIYSPHTAFDSTGGGINRQLAAGLALTDVHPLVPAPAGSNVANHIGGGRYGQLSGSQTLAQLAAAVKEFLNIQQVQIVGAADQPVQRVAVACGSAGEFLEPAHAAGCHVLLTGETRFHTCLEAEALGVALLLTGHYASERFAVETLAEVIGEKFPGLDVWASRSENDPLAWI